MPKYQITINNINVETSDTEYSDVTVEDDNEEGVDNNNKRVIDNSDNSVYINSTVKILLYIQKHIFFIFFILYLFIYSDIIYYYSSILFTSNLKIFDILILLFLI